MAEIKIYTTPTCPFCKKAKAWLNEHGVKYREINVVEDEAGRDHIVKKSGQTGVPQIEIGDKVIVGFDEAALQQEFGKKKARKKAA